MRIQLPPHVERLVNRLTQEDGTSAARLVSKLLKAEDRERHMIKPPFEKERRTRCHAPKCEEPDTRPRTDYEL